MKNYYPFSVSPVTEEIIELIQNKEPMSYKEIETIGIQVKNFLDYNLRMSVLEKKITIQRWGFLFRVWISSSRMFNTLTIDRKISFNSEEDELLTMLLRLLIAVLAFDIIFFLFNFLGL